MTSAIWFVGAGFESAGPGGLALTSAGRLATVDGAAAVRQALLLLLSTRPGERLLRPSYGCHLPRLVFAPNDDTTAGLAIHYVREAVREWEPRVEVLDVDAGPDPDVPSRLLVHLDYLVREDLTRDGVTLGVDLAAGA